MDHHPSLASPHLQEHDSHCRLPPSQASRSSSLPPSQYCHSTSLLPSCLSGGLCLLSFLGVFNFWFLLNNNDVFLLLTGLRRLHGRLEASSSCPRCDKSPVITPAVMSLGPLGWTWVVDLPGHHVRKPVVSLQTFLFLSRVWPRLNEGPFSYRPSRHG